MLVIDPAEPHDPAASALLDESQALMRALFTPDQNNFLSHDALAAPHVDLWTARRGDSPLGVVALARLNGYGEVKSLFVREKSRGQGVARALMRQLEDRARDHGIPWLRLETGVGLDAAQALYRSLGFRDCGPFGDYARPGAGISASVFMEKPLTDPRS